MSRRFFLIVSILFFIITLSISPSFSFDLNKLPSQLGDALIEQIENELNEDPATANEDPATANEDPATAKIKDTNNADYLEFVAQWYVNYLEIDELCGETIDLEDLQQEVKTIIELYPETPDVSEEELTQIKDVAWEQSLSQLEEDSTHQTLSITYAGLNPHERRTACRTYYDDAIRIFRTHRVAIEKMTKQDEKKERTF